MLSINTNLSSFIAQNSLKSTSLKLDTAIERMTTGYKINHAKDNAANYSIATDMTTKIGAYQVAEDNALQGLEMMSTSLESLNQISDKLNRMRALAVQTQNGTYGTQSLNAISAEANALLSEITRINESAEFNGIKLFNTGKMDVTNAGKELKLNEQGFLQDVVRVDTTGMTKLSSVDPNATLAVGEYSISTVEDLVQLQEMASAGLITTGSTFVLTENIDITAWCRANEATGGWTPIALSGSEFNGNGYTIKGLYINRNSSNQALFSSVKSVKNLRLTDVNITASGNYVAGICAQNSTMTNNSVIGKISSNGSNVGGIMGYSYYGSANYCYVKANIKGSSSVGGIFGEANYANISNSFSEGSVTATTGSAGGIVAGAYEVYNSKSSMNVRGKTLAGGICAAAYRQQSDNYFTGSVYGESRVGGLVADVYMNYDILNSIMEGSVSGPSDATGVLIGNAQGTNSKLANCSYYRKGVNVEALFAGSNDVILENNIDLTVPCDYTLQIASCGDSARSTLSYSTYIDFGELNSVLSSGIENAGTIEKIDELVNVVALKQTELGTAVNRLESVLEEISVQYENLVSSRSTILDTDIAEVSSEYIRQQILQQASATLMSTANQSPSIALQLL